MPKELWILANDDNAENNDPTLNTLNKTCIRSVMNTGIEGSDSILTSELREFVIDSPESVDDVTGSLGKEERIVLRFKDWKIIPLEDIISRSNGTKILVAVSDTDDASAYLNVLERGADGLVIDTSDENVIKRISALFLNDLEEELSIAVVKGVKHIGTGDRVCIDTIRMMSQDEGMLIGSHASCLFLVRSENDENGYIEARPFRVNAGSIHSYILVTGGRTRYLSELRGGDPILVIDSSGHAVRSSIGRCKIETRPMLMIQAIVNGIEHSVILQNAETVCLMGPEGALPVTSIKEGDSVYVKIDSPGRHCGISVEENVREL